MPNAVPKQFKKAKKVTLIQKKQHFDDLLPKFSPFNADSDENSTFLTIKLDNKLNNELQKTAQQWNMNKTQFAAFLLGKALMQSNNEHNQIPY